MWRELDELRALPLGDYGRAVDEIQSGWRRRYPYAKFSNARYCAYVEDALARGISVSDAILATLTVQDIRYDAHAFKNLAPLLEGRR